MRKNKAVYETGPTAVAFIDSGRAANRDDDVLPAMVNAHVSDRDKLENQVVRQPEK